MEASTTTCGRCHKPKEMIIDLEGKDFLLTRKTAKEVDNPKDFICMCGRPSDYTTDEEMCALVDEYLDTVKDDYKIVRKPYIDKDGNEREAVDVMYEVNLPMLEDFALMLGKDDDTIVEWRKKYPKFSAACRKIELEQKKRLINSGLSGNYNATIAKLNLSANHGMAEKTETDITSKGEKISGVAVEFIEPKKK